MMEWFQQREPREQFVVAICAILAVVVIGWKFLWLPLQQRSDELTVAVADNAELIVGLRRASGLAARSQGPSALNANTSLTVIINLTAEPLGLVSAIERSSPVGGSDAIRVSLRGASFDTLVGWLNTLDQQYGVGVATADIATTGQPGTINGQLILERS